jgi:hypothetical protein
MPLFCSGCAERRAPEQCTKKCREKYGSMTQVERFPRLDGFMWLEEPDCPSPEDQLAARNEHFNRKRLAD